MSSLYDELAAKLAQDPSMLKRGGPRIDISVMLFNARDDIRELWLAADECADADGQADTSVAQARLAAALEPLRPIFGERGAERTGS